MKKALKYLSDNNIKFEKGVFQIYLTGDLSAFELRALILWIINSNEYTIELDNGKLTIK